MLPAEWIPLELLARSRSVAAHTSQDWLMAVLGVTHHAISMTGRVTSDYHN